MKLFVELMDRLSWASGRNAKLRLIEDYMRAAPDPERGYALALLTGTLDLGAAKPNLIRKLVAERVDPALFAMSYDYVGDLSETVALIWPPKTDAVQDDPPLSVVVKELQSSGKATLPSIIERHLDRLDETGRWAFLKLITGGLRVGVSARLAKTAVAAIGGRNPDDIEEIWHALAPPYVELFDWLEGRSDHIAADQTLAFRPPMLAHALEASDFAAVAPQDYAVEWKWDGIRIQAVADENGRTVLYSRTGDEITGAFPDLVSELGLRGVALDGELLIVRDGRVQPFADLQQRLNRKTVSTKMLENFPAHLRAYDLLARGTDDLRPLPFRERRDRLELFLQRQNSPRLSLSPLANVSSHDDLVRSRAEPAASGAGVDAQAVEGVMLKRWDSPYLPGRPRGFWWKWKRDPFTVDAVLMYAQRGHGKRSSFYSDYTFGVWRDGALVPIGKAYFGFTDEELKEIDRFVRNNTIGRFGPVREVRHERDHGLVFEVAFEGINRSNRNRSGLALRFPRIGRIRWDKPPRDADDLDNLERMLPPLPA